MVRVVFDPHQSPIWFKAIVFLTPKHRPFRRGGPENRRCHARSNWGTKGHCFDVYNIWRIPYLNLPRRTRIDAPGALHHIVIRGIERKAIFKDDADRSTISRATQRVNRDPELLSTTKTIQRELKLGKKIECPYHLRFSRM